MHKNIFIYIYQISLFDLNNGEFPRYNCTDWGCEYSERSGKPHSATSSLLRRQEDQDPYLKVSTSQKSTRKRQSNRKSNLLISWYLIPGKL